MSSYREQLEGWLSRISINADRVIDIGGAAKPIPTRLKSFKANEYIIFDTGSEEVVVEQYVPFDINKPLTQLGGYGMGSFGYDCLFCLEVFEYVWNPVMAFENIRDLMCEDGVAYVSFPAIYPVHNPIEIDYLRYTRRAIEKYAEVVGLNILSITSRVAMAGSMSLANFYRDEGMHPVRHSELPFDIGYMVKLYKPYPKKGLVKRKIE